MNFGESQFNIQHSPNSILAPSASPTLLAFPDSFHAKMTSKPLENRRPYATD